MAGASGSSQQSATDKAISVSQEKEQEKLLKKKYGGLCPKKPPLIAKDNERAFFDSADWALCKQGVTHQHQHQLQLTGLQSLPPKLSPTPHQQLPARRASYSPTYRGARESAEDAVRRRDRRALSMSCAIAESCAPGPGGSPSDEAPE